MTQDLFRAEGTPYFLPLHYYLLPQKKHRISGAFLLFHFLHFFQKDSAVGYCNIGFFLCIFVHFGCCKAAIYQKGFCLRRKAAGNIGIESVTYYYRLVSVAVCKIHSIFGHKGCRLADYKRSFPRCREYHFCKSAAVGHIAVFGGTNIIRMGCDIRDIRSFIQKAADIVYFLECKLCIGAKNDTLCILIILDNL